MPSSGGRSSGATSSPPGQLPRNCRRCRYLMRSRSACSSSTASPPGSLASRSAGTHVSAPRQRPSASTRAGLSSICSARSLASSLGPRLARCANSWRAATRNSQNHCEPGRHSLKPNVNPACRVPRSRSQQRHGPRIKQPTLTATCASSADCGRLPKSLAASPNRYRVHIRIRVGPTASCGLRPLERIRPPQSIRTSPSAVAMRASRIPRRPPMKRNGRS